MPTSVPLFNKYVLVSPIHKGSSSVVFKAKMDGAFGFEKLIALKTLEVDQESTEWARHRLVRQAHIGSKISHHNIVGVYEFHEDTSTLYLAMELVEGSTLKTLLEQRRQQHRPLSLPYAANLVLQLLEGLDHLHTSRDPMTAVPLGLVHRNIHPGNVLIGTDGVVKLIGFGLCHINGGDETARLEDFHPVYARPELREGREPSPSSDLFCAALLLYEMLSLEPFFSSPEIHPVPGQHYHRHLEARLALIPEAAKQIEPLLRRALSAAGKERFHRARTMGQSLRSAMNPRPFHVPLKDIADIADIGDIGACELEAGSGESNRKDWDGDATDGMVETHLPSEETVQNTNDAIGWAQNPALQLNEDEELEYHSMFGSSPPVTHDPGIQTVNLAAQEWQEEDPSMSLQSLTIDMTLRGSVRSEAELDAEAGQETRVSSFSDAGDREPWNATDVSELDLSGCYEGSKSKQEATLPPLVAHDPNFHVIGSRDELASSRGTGGKSPLTGHDACGGPSKIGVSGPAGWWGGSHATVEQVVDQELAHSGLTLIFLSGDLQHRCPIPESGLSLGRAHSNDIVLADQSVAPLHASVLWEGGRWWIRSSRDQMMIVDGNHRTETPLIPGVLLQLGHIRFTVVEDQIHPAEPFINYAKLEEELVQFFPALARDELFLTEAGLELNEEVLHSSAKRFWREALRRLRNSPSPKPLVRLIDTLVKREPHAPNLAAARACLEKLSLFH